MFDFQKLEVFQKAKNFCKEITATINEKSFDRVTNDQLCRASFSIMLNIAEGSSRFSNKNRKNFLIVAREAHLNVQLFWNISFCTLNSTPTVRIKT
jgi:four helix bundle protein